jgi:hypothetical protein
VNTGTTNVPGPQYPVYMAGRRLLESFPYIPLFAHVRLAVAIFSYDGALNFGVSGDYDTAPDIDVLCRGIERGLAELVGVAEGALQGAAASAEAAGSEAASKEGAASPGEGAPAEGAPTG